VVAANARFSTSFRWRRPSSCAPDPCAPDPRVASLGRGSHRTSLARSRARGAADRCAERGDGDRTRVASLTCVTVVDPSGSGKEHAGARAWRRIWALRVREWELIGTLVVTVAVRPPVSRIETNAMAVRLYFRTASR
jgi:hypothetical protein